MVLDGGNVPFFIILVSPDEGVTKSRFALLFVLSSVLLISTNFPSFF